MKANLEIALNLKSLGQNQDKIVGCIASIETQRVAEVIQGCEV